MNEKYMGRTRHQCGPSRRTDRRGATAVQFALTLPVLVVLLFGALELGRMNMIRQMANNAAYEAARACTVPGGNVADGEAAGRAILQAIGVQGATVDVQPDPIVNATPIVTATVTVPYQTNMWVTPLFSRGKSVTVTCQMTRDWVVSTRQSY
jgi:Flp pilus assembly protein TadG